MPDGQYTGEPRLRTRSSSRRHGHYPLRAGMSRPMDDDDKAIVGRTTRFTSTIREASDPDAGPLLKPGIYQRKIGNRVKVGEWAGAFIYCLTLVERMTCPEHCLQWRTCYGNNMHRATRFDPLTGGFLDRLEGEVRDLCARHKKVAIRLHILGDFFSILYVAFWGRMLDEHPNLMLFGFTAHPHPKSVRGKESSRRIGRAICELNEDPRLDGRCAIRFSGHPGAFGSFVVPSSVPKADPPAPEEYDCPAQFSKTDGCDTCGMCWSRAHRGRAVVFRDHGQQGTGRKPKEDQS